MHQHFRRVTSSQHVHAARRAFLPLVAAALLLSAAACDDGGSETSADGDASVSMTPADATFGGDAGISGSPVGFGADASVLRDAGTLKLDGSTPAGGAALDAGKPADAGGASDAGSTGVAGDAGTAGDAGNAGTAGDAGTTPQASATDLCHVPGKEIAVLGDSYVALSYNQPIPGDVYPFTTELQKLARAAGALGATETYREYSVSGAAMAPGDLAVIKPIPKQLDDALAAGKTTVIFMDGGGNDVLVDNRNCLDFKSSAEVAASKECTAVVDRAIAAGQKMFDTGVAAGVKGVVYFFYPHLPKDSLGGGAGANYMLDYAIPRVRQFCESQAKAKCHFVDMRKAFDDGTMTGKDDGSGYPREGLIEFDGIHPTAEGSKILAAEFWKVMQANCVASK
jgi:lysophospholipase L1-like esterase